MRFLGRLFSVVCVLSVLSACSDKAESLPIVPYPQDVVIETGSFNALGAKVISDGLDDAEIALVDKFGKQIASASGNKKGLSKIVFRRDDSLEKEAYRLEIGNCKAVAYSSSYNGLTYPSFSNFSMSFGLFFLTKQSCVNITTPFILHL